MDRPYTFYYSSYCKYCRNLCQQLFADGALSGRFKFVNADNTRACRGMNVPTLIVANHRYVGTDAFAWVSRQQQQGPACYELGGGCGLEFSELDGGHGTTRGRNFCSLAETGASPMAALAAGPHAPVMDARVARLIRAREQQVARPCGRVG